MVSLTQSRSLLQDGIAAARIGDKNRARDLLSEVIRENPQDEAAWVWLAQTVDAPGDAVSALEKVLSINPNNAQAYEDLQTARLQAGMAAARARNRDEAREHLLGVVAADPCRELAWFWLAAVADTPQESIDCLLRVLELSPNNRKARAALRISQFQAGVADAQAGRRDAARQHLQAVVSKEPNHETAWHWLSTVAASPADAAAYLRKVLEINPNNTQAQDDLNRCQDEIAAAQAQWTCPFCSGVAAAEPEQCATCGAVMTLANPDAFLQNAKLDAERVGDAAAKLEKAIGPQSPAQGHFHLGLAHLNLFQWEPAIVALRASLTLQPATRALRAQFNALVMRKQAFLDAAHRGRLASPSGAPLETWAGPCVLVVDSSADDRTAVSEALEWQGFRVVAAADGNEAALQARQVKPDLILMATDLPGADGYQLCREIKAHPATQPVPVVLLTSKNGFFEKLRGRFAGCEDYLAKPVSPTQLLEVARQYTAKP